MLSTVSTVVLNQAVEAGPHDTEPGYTHTHTKSSELGENSEASEKREV